MSTITRIKKVSPFVEVVFDPFVFGGSYRRATKFSRFVQTIAMAGAIVAIAYVHFNPIIK